MKILIILLLTICSLQAGWMNVDSINVKQKWRNKKLNTDALLYVKSSDSLLDTCNIYYDNINAFLSIGGPGGYPFHIYQFSYFESGVQVEGYFTADSGAEINGGKLYIQDSIWIDYGSNRLSLFGDKNAPSTAYGYCEIATTGGSFSGLNNGSLIFQPASNLADKSIAFLGGTTGKLTAEILDTTVFRVLTDSVYIAGVTKFNNLLVDSIGVDNQPGLIKLDQYEMDVNGDINLLTDLYMEYSGGTWLSSWQWQNIAQATSALPALTLNYPIDSIAFPGDPSTLTFGEMMTFSAVNQNIGIKTGLATADYLLEIGGYTHIEDNLLVDDSLHVVGETVLDGIVDINDNIIINGNYISYDGATDEGLTFSSSNRVNIYSDQQFNLALQDQTAIAEGVGGGVLFDGVYTGAGAMTSFAAIHAYKANATSGSVLGQLHLQSRQSGGLTTGIMIDETGQVGIGTTDPSELFHISGGNILLDNNQEIRQEDNGAVERTILSLNSSNELGVGTSAGDLVLYAGSGAYTERARILASNGQVGIGEASPEGKLHVKTASAGTVTAPSGSNELVLENSDNCGISILCPDNEYGQIYFGSPSNSTAATLQWRYDLDTYRMGTLKTGAELVFASDNNSEAMRIDDSGKVGIGIAPTNNAKVDINSGALDQVMYLESTDANAKIVLKDLASTQYIVTQNSLLSLGSNGSYAGFGGNLNIDASGNVGIGTNSFSSLLHVYKGASAGGVSATDALTIEDDNDASINLASGASQQGYVYFSDATRGQGYIQYDHASDKMFINVNGGTRVTIDDVGYVGIGTTSPSEGLDLNNDAIRVRNTRTPASASATGTTGTICWDASYIYVCVATNTWKRTAISTW